MQSVIQKITQLKEIKKRANSFCNKSAALESSTPAVTEDAVGSLIDS